MENIYDYIILGGGPAGMTSAIYGARYKLKTLIIAEDFGGTANEAHFVENYPGFKSITGIELMQKFKEHMDSYNVEALQKKIVDVQKRDNFYEVKTEDNSAYYGKTVLIGLGSERRKLDVKGEDEFLGKGVSYCATCDAFFYRNKVVAVIGGGDAAAQAALLLAQHSSKVYIIYRRDKLRCEPHWRDLINATDKIEIIYNHTIKEIKGENVVKLIELDDGTNINVDGVFVEIGHVPRCALAHRLGVKCDEHSHIIVNTKQETNIPGVFAAGDICTGSIDFKQIITACAHGAMAALSAYNYVQKNV